MQRCTQHLPALTTHPLTVNSIYGNEHEVGQGIIDSGVPRKDIFITGKLWNTHHSNAKEGLQETLDALGTDYLDLYVSLLRRRLAQSDC
jgi:diketogulonate reductase-like aldo/keto reductase